MLDLTVPEGLPSPDDEIVGRFSPKSIVMIMIDNFGLFEAVVYKPETMIKKMEALALLNTDDPYAIPLITTVLQGSQKTGFHLLSYVKRHGKFTRAICHKDDVGTFDFETEYTIPVHNDMNAYIESTKYIFRSELLYIHFLDFESLYAQYGHRTPPQTLLEKIVRRTDNWVKVLMRQARDDTLFVIIGNHGRTPIPLEYEGKLVEWRKANAPIAIMFQKRSE